MIKLSNYAGRGDLGRMVFNSAGPLLASLTLAGSLHAGQLDPFDVIVADSQATIYSFNPRTRERTVIAEHGLLERPYDLARNHAGNLVVSDTGTDRIVQVNPLTHQQTVLAEGPALGVPFGLDVDRHDRIYVANGRAIVRVDPASRSMRTVATGGLLRAPLDVAVASDGTLFVADALAGVIHLNPATRKQTLLAHGGFLHTPTGITLDGDRTAYVVDAGGRCVVAVDTQTGNQTLLSANGFLTTPVGIALVPGGTMLVSDPDAFNLDGGIMLIELDGTQTPIFQGYGDLVNARGIAVVPAL